MKLPPSSDVSLTQDSENSKPGFRRFYGLTLALLAALTSSFKSMFIKKANMLSGSDQTTIRFLIQLFIYSTIALALKKDLRKSGTELKLLMTRALLGVVGYIAATFAITLVDPSDFVAISHTSLIITSVLSRVFLSEKLTLFHFVSIISAFSGCLMILQPKFIFGKPSAQNSTDLYKNSTPYQLGNESLFVTIGIVAAFLSAFSMGSSKILIRKLSIKKVHYAVMILYTSILGLPVSLIISTFLIMSGTSKWAGKLDMNYLVESDLKWHILYAVGAGIIGAVNNFLMIKSLTYEQPTKVSIVKMSDIIFIFIIQYFFLGLHSNSLKIIGAVLVLLSGLVILLYKIMDEKHEKNKAECKPNLFSRILFKKF